MHHHTIMSQTMLKIERKLIYLQQSLGDQVEGNDELLKLLLDASPSLRNDEPLLTLGF